MAGWKHREFPVLYNAFHVGDQILTVAGIPIKTVSEFNKLVKQKTPPQQVSYEHEGRFSPMRVDFTGYYFSVHCSLMLVEKSVAKIDGRNATQAVLFIKFDHYLRL